MLPKSHRLNLSTTKPGVSFPGVKLRSPHLMVIYHPNSTHLGLGIIVSKRVSIKAVTRNLIKRRLVATVIKLLPLTTQIDLLIIPRPSITALTYQQLLQEFSVIITKLSLGLHQPAKQQ